MMEATKNKKTPVAIAIVLALGVVLGIAILRTDKAKPAGDEHGHAQSAAPADDEHHGRKGSEGHAHEAGHEDKEHHATAAQAAPQTGPHGGKLFTQEGFGLELTIFETDVEPEFRLYLYRDGKPLAPHQATVTVTLQRLGREAETFRFKPEKDYLKGVGVVAEPHSFEVAIQARSAGKDYAFGFEQVEGRVQLSETQLKQNGIEIATAGPARIASSLQLLGEVRLNQDRTVLVTPRLAGLVESVAANAGDRVRRGQVLAVLSSQALADQRGELLAAQKRLALARTSHEREKKLFEDKISAEQDYLQARQAFQEAEIAAESARQKLAALGAAATPSTQGLTRLEIRSPIDGVVIEKKISVGEALKEDAPIFQVADLSSVWVELAVPARDLGQLAIGASALVKASAFEAQAQGRLSYVGALIGEQNRSAVARVVLPNPKGLWRPGLPVQVTLKGDEAQVPVAVAVDAVQTLRAWSVVFGRYGQQFEARPVELGRSDGRFVEVIKGLNAGEAYAARNSFLIKADIGKAGAEHDH
ncbi:efflux RND transporter periplasmic adaptor subunit [Roseateles flavus]|uniref:Efflux RND transporter periplasmic adaptor subunit n=1 Tax=Roseateles flavus TaxID=3149041 RepID=A0ABV0GJH4_9BURK